MNLCRCENGHFYDKERYEVCPHCGGSDMGSKNAHEDADDQTVVFTTPEGNGYSAGNTESLKDIIPEIGGGFKVDDMTAGTKTESGDATEILNSNKIDDNNDATVSLWENDFINGANNNKNDPVGSGFKQPEIHVQKKAQNRVSSPCVGWLIALGGGSFGTDFRLKTGKNFIGRNEKMDIALTEDKSVSRERHAIVVYDPKSNMYLVQPGDSSSLAYHNNELLLTPKKLEAYDTITVGDVNLLFIPLCGERFSWGPFVEEMKRQNQ